MKWNILYYNEKVEKQVFDLPNALLARYIRMASVMIDEGPNLGMPHTRAMHDALFEMRVKSQEGIARVFYCTAIGKNIVMLHSFVKKQQKTPLKELKIARDRLKEIKVKYG